MRTDRVVSTKLAIGADDGGRRRWSRRCIVDISRVKLVIRWRRRIRSSSSGCWNWRGHMKLDWIVNQSTTHPPHQLQTLIIQKEKLLTETVSDLTYVTMWFALKWLMRRPKHRKSHHDRPFPGSLMSLHLHCGYGTGEELFGKSYGHTNDAPGQFHSVMQWFRGNNAR